MSRRHGTPWAATSVPEIRRQWCHALDQLAERFTTHGLTPPAPGEPVDRRRQSMQTQLAAEVQVMKAETETLRTAGMYWVARDMVDLAMDAAATLPEWTPQLVLPAPAGMLCWAKAAGTVPCGPAPTSTADVTWDAVFWWHRPDGMLQLVPSSRFTKNPDLIALYEVTTPLWAAHTIVIDPSEPRTEEANGSEAAHRFVSVVGAAWLLMSQPGVTDHRTITDAPCAPSTSGNDDSRPPSSGVTLIDVRRPTLRRADTSETTNERTYNHRWWVAPHWRQQACGPNHSQRKPKYILAYSKGPEGKPFTTRVNVWRR